MLQGILKSLPQYASHIRAEVNIPSTGREFIVVDNDEAFVGPAEEAAKLYNDMLAKGGGNMPNPDRPVIYHVAEPSSFNKDHIAQKQGRLIDIPGKPLLLNAAAYEYMKHGFGHHLSCEPLGGSVDPMAAQSKIYALEQENARLKAEASKAAPVAQQSRK